LASLIGIIKPLCDLPGLWFGNVIGAKYNGISVRVPYAPTILRAGSPDNITIVHYRCVATGGKLLCNKRD
jgi:hypothetical protein